MQRRERPSHCELCLLLFILSRITELVDKKKVDSVGKDRRVFSRKTNSSCVGRIFADGKISIKRLKKINKRKAE